MVNSSRFAAGERCHCRLTRGGGFAWVAVVLLALIHHREAQWFVRSVGKLTLGWRRPQRSCLAGAAEVVGISYGRPGTTRPPGAMGRYIPAPYYIHFMEQLIASTTHVAFN